MFDQQHFAAVTNGDFILYILKVLLEPVDFPWLFKPYNGKWYSELGVKRYP